MGQCWWFLGEVLLEGIRCYVVGLLEDIIFSLLVFLNHEAAEADS